MYISKLNTSIIHIPKTGGGTLSKFVSKNNLMDFHIGHTTISEIIEKNGEWYNRPDYQTEKILKSKILAVVRNPYDRMRSYYSFVKNNERDLWGHEVDSMTFDDFLGDCNGISHPHFGKISDQRALWSQSKYVYHNDQLKVELIRFEDFMDFFHDFFGKMGYDLKSNFVHTHKSKSDSVLLTKEQKDIIYNRYKEDFDNFGFKK